MEPHGKFQRCNTVVRDNEWAGRLKSRAIRLRLAIRTWLRTLRTEVSRPSTVVEVVVLVTVTVTMTIWLDAIRGVGLALISHLVVAVSVSLFRLWLPTLASCLGAITLALLGYASLAAVLIAYTPPTTNNVRAAFCGLLATAVIVALRVAPGVPKISWGGILAVLVAVPTVASLIINAQPMRRVTVTLMSKPSYDGGQVPFPKPIGVDSTFRVETSESAPEFQVAHGGSGSVLVNDGDRFVITIATDIECSSPRLERNVTEGASLDVGNMERTFASQGGTSTSLQHLEPAVPAWVSSFAGIVSAGLLPPAELSGTYYLHLADRVRKYNVQWGTNDVTCKPATIIPASRSASSESVTAWRRAHLGEGR